MKFIERELSGWGRFPNQTCQVARPEKRREIMDAPRNASTPDLLARGLGRAYGDAALNENSGVVLLEKLDHFLDFDTTSGVLHAQAGASFEQILQEFMPRGWFLPVTPGTRFVTLGGAIACDVHGKNHHRDGCLSNFISELELLLASGEILICTPTQNADAFWATIGGMGLTGIILSAKLRLQPIETNFVQATYQRTNELDETLAAFADDKRHHYSVAWLDCLAIGNDLGRAVIIRGEHATRRVLPAHVEPLSSGNAKTKAVPFNFPSLALNSYSVRAFNALYYAVHGDGEKLVPSEPFFWPLDSIQNWNRIYGARGFIQYQCVLPFETSRDGLKKLLEKISRAKRASFLAVLKTFGPENRAPLSFPFAGHTLALDLPADKDIAFFARELDAIVLEHGGRVYLAKDATLAPEHLKTMYPRLDEWREIKSRLDPYNKFQSSLSKRLKI